jgi:hypothetical protein
MRLREVEQRRVLVFDLENRPSAYWYDGQTTSEITAFGWKWTDEPDVHTLLLRADGSFDSDGRKVKDRAAYERFSGVLQEAGLVVGHNIRRHDLPIFKSGLLRRSMPLPGPLLTCDTLRDYPKRNGLSASLENLAAMYGLEGEKYTMSQPMWEAANKLTSDGIALARRRVTSDVLLQEALRGRLLELGLLAAPRVWK